MNVTELARKLRVNTNDLFELLPKIGFDIGKRAIKVDDVIAQRIIKEWPRLIRELDDRRRLAREAKEAESAVAQANATQTAIAIPAVITVRELAVTLNLPVTRLIRELMNNGVLATMNERIDHTTATIIAQDLGFKVQDAPEERSEKTEEATGEKLKALLAQTDGKDREPRPPVVVVMGHIDHGKTKLLDTIRETNVVAGEAGGITQHIGAYQVDVATSEGGRRTVTFIDTPGHEAFMTMRTRGAKIADIAILVVAADDGVKPQTEEALRIIRGAGLPIVVALNKIDKPEANLDKTKQELSKLDLIPEEWGGKIPMVPISAKAKTGLETLLATILLLADLEKEKLHAEPNRDAVGTIIESHIDKGEGPVATMLVHTGTLHRNDLLLIDGTLHGKVRAMKDHRGAAVDAAGPSAPVKIIGFRKAPAVGDVIEATTDASRVERTAETREGGRTATIPQTTIKIVREKSQKFPVIIKTDVLGSLEAIIGILEQVDHPEVGLEIVHKGLGKITDADVLTAEATKARIYAFNVATTPTAQVIAAEKGVVIERYDVIYHLERAIHSELEKLLAPEIRRTILGTAKILAIFRQERGSVIAGGSVTDGQITSTARIRLLRDQRELGPGKIAELQSGKRATPSVRAGQEFGIKLDTKLHLAVGDIVEAYSEEQIERSL